MPVSKISIFADSSPNFGGSRWIGQRSPVDGFLAVDWIADHVPDAPERDVADGNRDRLARVDDLGAACKTVGRVHRNGANAIVAEMLLHLCDQLAVIRLDAERVVDRRQLIREDGVEDDALDLDDAAGVLFFVGHESPEVDHCKAGSDPAGRGLTPVKASGYWVKASAPATISRISCVICACRARFICSVKVSINSPAFFDAFRIAVICAARNEVADSSSAR